MRKYSINGLCSSLLGRRCDALPLVRHPSLPRPAKLADLFQCPVHFQRKPRWVAKVFQANADHSIAHAGKERRASFVIRASGPPVRQFENQASVAAHVVDHVRSDGDLGFEYVPAQQPVCEQLSESLAHQAWGNFFRSRSSEDAGEHNASVLARCVV